MVVSIIKNFTNLDGNILTLKKTFMLLKPFI